MGEAKNIYFTCLKKQKHVIEVCYLKTNALVKRSSFVTTAVVLFPRKYVFHLAKTSELRVRTDGRQTRHGFVWHRRSSWKEARRARIRQSLCGSWSILAAEEERRAVLQLAERNVRRQQETAGRLRQVFEGVVRFLHVPLRTRRQSVSETKMLQSLRGVYSGVWRRGLAERVPWR